MPKPLVKMQIDDIQLSRFGEWARTVDFADVDIKAGVFPGKFYQRGAKRVPLAKVAAINEYGAPSKNIPARPIIRFARGKIAREFKRIYEGNIIRPGRTIGIGFSAYQLGRPRRIDIPENIKEEIGEMMVDQLIDTAIGKRRRPNAPATIRKKGFDKPLIDTTKMISAGFEYRIDGKKNNFRGNAPARPITFRLPE